MNAHDFQTIAVPFLYTVSSVMAWLTARVAVKKVNEVHVLMNSRLTELIAVKDEMIEAARLAGHAAGMEQGTALGLQQAAASTAAGNVTVTGSPVMVTGDREYP
jgi:hypothetical protein